MRSRSLSNWAASRCRAARISSVGVNGVIGHPCDFFGGTNNGRFVSVVAAHLVDAVTKRSVGNVFEIPRHQVLYAVSGGDSNVERIARLRCRNCLSIHQCVGQAFCCIGDLQPRDSCQFINAFLCCVGITRETFVNDELRDEEPELRSCSGPPEARRFLPRGDQGIRVPSTGNAAHDSCFDVNSIHRGIVSRRTDQHSTADRVSSRFRITKTGPPRRSVAVRGYPPCRDGQ